MKKRVLKMISLMMAAVLMLGCAACGNSGEGVAETGNGDTAETDNEATQPADDGAEAAGDEKVTITLWSQFSDPNSTDATMLRFTMRWNLSRRICRMWKWYMRGRNLSPTK